MEEKPLIKEETKSTTQPNLFAKAWAKILIIAAALGIIAGAITNMGTVGNTIGNTYHYFFPPPVKLPPQGKVLYTHPAPRYGGALAWSPDGKHIAQVNTDGTIQVWDATTGQNLITYTGHKGKNVLALAWSHDSTHLASTDADGTIQIWLAASWFTVYIRSIASFLEQTNRQVSNSPVNAMVWSPNDGQIAFGDSNGDVVMATVGDNLRYFDVLERYPGPVLSLIWSSDGKQLVIGGPGDYTSLSNIWDTTALEVWNWDVSSFPAHHTRTSIYQLGQGHGLNLVDLTLSPNGNYVAAMVLYASATAPSIWDITAKGSSPQPIGRQAISLAWACDNNRIALGCDNDVTICDYSTQ